MENFAPSLKHLVLEFMQHADYLPMKQHELAQSLKIDPMLKRELRKALRDLESEGKIIKLRKNRWGLPEASDQITGRIRVHAHGFAFVTPEASDHEDIFIPEERMGVALDGDKVFVSLISQEFIKRKRRRKKQQAHEGPVGQVISVIERARISLTGLLKRTPYYWYVVPDNPRILKNIRIRMDEDGADTYQEDHKVNVRLDEWKSPEQELSGVILEDLGIYDRPGIDIDCLIRDFQYDTNFPEAVLKDAEKASPTPPEEEIARRRDLRSITCVTIDPVDARDFDDAVSLERKDDSHWLLGVHIADVAHYVRPGSAVDKEAAHRGTSVYLVDRVITMLPRRLTTDICSLQPESDRLTHSVMMELDEEGEIIKVETFPSVIRSSARLNYQQVQTLIEKKEGHGIPESLHDMLNTMHELAKRLRKKRVSEGSIDIVMPEVRCILDHDGIPDSFSLRTETEAYHLIEEFMLLANQSVAIRLAEAMHTALYRIHDEPDAEQWERMGAELSALGVEDMPIDRKGLNAVARAYASSPQSYAVNLSILRNMKRAMYFAQRREHFGLAFEYYTHFTSPIRRYPDLIVHRLLNVVEQQAKSRYTPDQLVEISMHCSDTEDKADQAERESLEVKRIAYYHRLLLAGKTGPFEGVIVSMNPKGMIVELSQSLQRGLVAFSSFHDDFYVLDKTGTTARGQRRKKGWTVGDRVQVCLSRVDKARRWIDLYIDIPSGPGKKKKNRKGIEKRKRRKYKVKRKRGKK